MRVALFASIIVAGSLCVACVSALSSCNSTSTKQQAKANSQATPTATATAAAAKESPATPAADAHAGALHNVHPLNDRVISGAVPEGDAAFDELRAMGVKTIISVDGATPDVAAAEARGMRYVHIPITYAQVTDEEQVEIARAIRDLPGPVFVHCHHGKHRSPSAVASAGVALGMITPDEGLVFIKNAGTAPNYEGLYACVAEAVVVDEATLNAAPNDFPSVRRAEGMTAAMVQVDLAFEHLGGIRAAQWKTPAAHPDLVPAAEAGRLADNLRFSGEDVKALALGDDYLARLNKAVSLATALEEALVRNASSEELEAAYKAVNASCKDCHAVYRDKPR